MLQTMGDDQCRQTTNVILSLLAVEEVIDLTSSSTKVEDLMAAADAMCASAEAPRHRMPSGTLWSRRATGGVAG